MSTIVGALLRRGTPKKKYKDASIFINMTWQEIINVDDREVSNKLPKTSGYKLASC
jgi:hypothetical protein|tara:strand:- start:8997 stop:9164 length:168 start_codon:yes stop_codon:yes gene_type:complete